MEKTYRRTNVLWDRFKLNWTGITEQLQFLLYLQVFRTAGFCSPSTFPINVFLIYPNSKTKQNLSLQKETEVILMQQLLVSHLSVQLPMLFHCKFKVIFKNDLNYVDGQRYWQQGCFLLFSESKLLLFPAPPWLDSQKSTETRQTTLSDYCHSLVNLPPHISRCTHLTGFFTVRPEDENPPSPNMSVLNTHPSVIIIKK